MGLLPLLSEMLVYGRVYAGFRLSGTRGAGVLLDLLQACLLMECAHAMEHLLLRTYFSITKQYMHYPHAHAPGGQEQLPATTQGRLQCGAH